ncbi:MAG: hypothetical protein WA862_03255 [Solirubrobacterales bacterium]
MALLAPGAAGAATVVNGNFESGALNGWNVYRANEVGNWFAYQGTSEPIADKRGGEPVQPPPQGTYAAIADELNPETLILSQDVVLGSGREHRLSLLAYYDSYVPIAVPTPDTLSANSDVLAGQPNQQFRIDVMTLAAPIDSVAPTDILRTVFRTLPGDPKRMLPTRLTADLSAFAGQTVRLRIAVAAHEEVLAAGVDAISIASNLPGQGPGSKGPGGNGSGLKPRGSTQFGLGRATINKRNGTATLPVRVPGAGLLTAKGESVSAKGARASATKAGKRRLLTKPARVRAAGAGTVLLRLKPTAAARKILEEKQKLRVRLIITYAPTGGVPEATSLPLALRLTAGPRQRR